MDAIPDSLKHQLVDALEEDKVLSTIITIETRLKKLEPRAAFCLRLLQGRAFRIIKDRSGLATWTDSSVGEQQTKTIKQLIKLHDLVVEHAHLRFSWPLNSVSKYGKKLVLSTIEREKLEFGGRAPVEKIQLEASAVVVGGAWIDVLPVWFCLMMDRPPCRVAHTLPSHEAERGLKLYEDNPFSKRVEVDIIHNTNDDDEEQSRKRVRLYEALH
jgi:hypothetical protein